MPEKYLHAGRDHHHSTCGIDPNMTGDDMLHSEYECVKESSMFGAGATTHRRVVGVFTTGECTAMAGLLYGGIFEQGRPWPGVLGHLHPPLSSLTPTCIIRVCARAHPGMLC